MKKFALYTFLLSSVAFAACEEDYELNGEKLVLATARTSAYKKELANATFIREIKGSELVGLHYTPLFPYFADYREKYEKNNG